MALTYPVDTTQRFDVWGTDTNAMATRIKDGVETDVVNIKWPREDGMPLEGKPDTVVLLQRVKAVETYDPLTHRLGAVTGPVVDLVAETSTYTRPAIPITQEELDAIVTQEEDNAEREVLKNWYQTFKDGNATNLQAQKAIAWLIKQTAGV